MARLIEILGSFEWIFGGEGVGGGLLGLFEVVLVHDLLDAALHHAEVLFGVDVLGLALVLHVLHLPDLALVLLVALDAVVDAGRSTRRLIQQVLEVRH